MQYSLPKDKACSPDDPFQLFQAPDLYASEGTPAVIFFTA